MTPFALVHGGWHGGPCWQRAAARLIATGYEVHGPTHSSGGAVVTGVAQRAVAGRRYDAIATGHDAMVTAPDEVAAALLGAWGG